MEINDKFNERSLKRETLRKIRFTVPVAVSNLIDEELKYYNVSMDKFFNTLILEFGFSNLPNEEFDGSEFCEKKVILFNLKIKNDVFNKMMALGKHEMVTTYLRKIVTKYFSLTPDKRERIILSDMFNSIERAIEKKHQIKIYVNDRILDIYPQRIEKCRETGYNKLLTKSGSYPVAGLEILKVEKSFYASAILMLGAFEHKVVVTVNDILCNANMIIDTTPKVGKIIAAAGGTLLVGTVATNSVVEKIKEKKEYVKVIKRIETVREKQTAKHMLGEPLMVSNVDDVIDNLIALQAPLPEMILEKVTIPEKNEVIQYLKILETSKIEAMSTSNPIKIKSVGVIRKIKKQHQPQIIDLSKKNEPLEVKEDVKALQTNSEAVDVYINFEEFEE